jgi:hypothetical protein
VDEGSAGHPPEERTENYLVVKAQRQRDQRARVAARAYFAAQADQRASASGGAGARQAVEVVAGAGFGTTGHAEVEERSPADEEPAAVAVGGDVAVAVPGVAHAVELAESEQIALLRREKRKAKKRRQAQRKKATKVQQAPAAEAKDELPMAGAPEAVNFMELAEQEAVNFMALAATAADSEVVSRAENPAEDGAKSKQRLPLVEESEGAADADDDRKEEKAEEDKVRSLFEAFDANSDGLLDLGEFVAYLTVHFFACI